MGTDLTFRYCHAVALFLAACMSPITNADAGASEVSPSSGTVPPRMAAKITALQGRASGTAAYRNLALFAATEADAPRRGMTVVVKGERIAAVVASNGDSESIPTGAEIIDGTGWFAIPGLIDSHVHLATLPNQTISERYLKRYLYGGITTVRDMAGDARSLANLARAALVNEIPAPDVKYAALMAGPTFFEDPRTITSALGLTPGHVPWLQAIDDETDIRLAVALARGTWATGIKIYANLPGHLLRAIVAEGRHQGIPVWTHAKVYPATPFDSLGAQSVSHVCMLARHLAEIAARERGSEAAPRHLQSVDLEHSEFRNYVKALADSGTLLDVTAAMNSQALPGNLPSNGQDGEARTDDRPRGPSRCEIETVILPMLRALDAAGVRFVAGTDFSTPGDDPFPALIVELEHLARVDSLSAADVIRTATINAAEALGLAHEIGTIEVGKHANLVFVEENPLESVGGLRSVVLTVKRGHRFHRADYRHEAIPKLPFPDRAQEASGSPGIEDR